MTARPGIRRAMAQLALSRVMVWEGPGYGPACIEPGPGYGAVRAGSPASTQCSSLIRTHTHESEKQLHSKRKPQRALTED